VAILKKFRHQVLQELLVGHMSMSKMKALARSYCFWKNIDDDIEQTVKSCKNCCSIQNNVSKPQLHPWEFPSQPWERLHVDYVGPFMNYIFLITVDAHTKWPETYPTKSTSSTTNINILCDIFSRFGLPYIIVSDNGSQFKFSEFEEFLKSNDIHHKCSAPYHPTK
jgi:hypothetical protein